MLDKMPGDRWQKHASLRALFGYMFGHPGKKLMFMGAELAQSREWNFDDSLDWHLLDDRLHRGLRRWVQDLNHLYQREAALHQVDFEPAGFSWIDCNDNENSVVSMIRRARNPQDFCVVVANFTPVPRHGYRVGVPKSGNWREILNSDASIYGGSGVGNRGGIHSEQVGWHGHDQSVAVTIPPLGIVVFVAE
jgi:1,4-alpha-glucan branching enzyme